VHETRAFLPTFFLYELPNFNPPCPPSIPVCFSHQASALLSCLLSYMDYKDKSTCDFKSFLTCLTHLKCSSSATTVLSRREKGGAAKPQPLLASTVPCPLVVFVAITMAEQEGAVRSQALSTIVGKSGEGRDILRTSCGHCCSQK